MLTFAVPDPFNGDTLRGELSAAGLGAVPWAAVMDGGLVFDAADTLRPRIQSVLAAHDGRPVPPPPSAEERIAELEAQVQALAAPTAPTAGPAPPATPAAATATTRVTGKVKA